MAEIVNLNRARKVRAKAAAAGRASANRAAFGRTKAEKQADRDEVRRREALLDGTRRDPPGPAGD